MAAKKQKSDSPLRFCGAKPEPERQFASSIDPERASLVLRTGNKWANGTVLHYCFFNSPARWKGTETQKNRVRSAFKKWKSIGIGLEFEEVKSLQDAEIRIGFQANDGHWSYIGRAILNQGPNSRTMNLDKSDNWDIDTALHEIGHTLGLPHEHQNPNAGIEWDEQKVYEALSQPPNSWDHQKTYHNIIRKLDPDAVQGSKWDPDSIMHYPFEKGLIKKPAKYQSKALQPAPGLSKRDKTWIKTFYPPLPSSAPDLIKPFNSVPLQLEFGEQQNFTIKPSSTRRYTCQTFGECDSTLVLFQIIDGVPRFLAGDDDGGENRNALINEKLHAGSTYVLRVRMAWCFDPSETALMLW